jgi:beta-lactamase class D
MMPQSRMVSSVSRILFLAIFLSGCTGTDSAAPTTQSIEQPTDAAVPTSASETRPDFEKYFSGYSTGAFVLYDLMNDRYTRYNPERCAERFIPASTFKIMNALGGLESGVIPDENYAIKWDGTHYDVPEWNQDHTLKTAFQVSAVWYYQEVARRVGQERIQQYVDAANYGNRDISGQIDTFWLEGGLRISADEQVGFLKKLYLGELPFSQRSMDIIKSIMVIEDTDEYTFSGKTGTALRVNPPVGWFVGYLETNNDVYFFATNIELETALGNIGKAQDITRAILYDQELMQ